MDLDDKGESVGRLMIRLVEAYEQERREEERMAEAVRVVRRAKEARTAVLESIAAKVGGRLKTGQTLCNPHVYLDGGTRIGVKSIGTGQLVLVEILSAYDLDTEIEAEAAVARTAPDLADGVFAAAEIDTLTA